MRLENETRLCLARIVSLVVNNFDSRGQAASWVVQLFPQVVGEFFCCVRGIGTTSIDGHLARSELIELVTIESLSLIWQDLKLINRS